ncbi:MAG: HNH endonuclease [Phycisphaerales bacterium JB039]
MAERRSWTRDELLVAFNLYCRTPFGRLHRSNPDIVELASRLGRTPSSAAMKLCNFASLDPALQARGIKGLSGASRQDQEIFAEFAADWARLASESEEARERLGLATAEVEAPAAPADRPTEATATVKVRRLQSLFRVTVLASYDYTCAISGICVPQLLQASHIVPWAVDESRRLDPRNGLALSALHDRAFDRGLITLDDDLRVVVSGRLRTGAPSDIHRAALLEIEGQAIRHPTRWAPDPEALAWHREHVFAA